jgi:hypothetical protein
VASSSASRLTDAGKPFAPRAERMSTRSITSIPMSQCHGLPVSCLVTFTLPAELRGCFFGTLARQACDLFFAAVSGSLAERLAADKGLRASNNDCHPRAKAARLRAQLHSGSAVKFGAGPVRHSASFCQKCSRCGQPMRLRGCLPPAHKIRGPPAAKASQPSTSIAA